MGWDGIDGGHTENEDKKEKKKETTQTCNKQTIGVKLVIFSGACSCLGRVVHRMWTHDTRLQHEEMKKISRGGKKQGRKEGGGGKDKDTKGVFNKRERGG